jgi:predicted nucleic acid-binding protein
MAKNNMSETAPNTELLDEQLDRRIELATPEEVKKGLIHAATANSRSVKAIIQVREQGVEFSESKIDDVVMEGLGILASKDMFDEWSQLEDRPAFKDYVAEQFVSSYDEEGKVLVDDNRWSTLSFAQGYIDDGYFDGAMQGSFDDSDKGVFASKPDFDYGFASGHFKTLVAEHDLRAQDLVNQ